MQTGVAAYLVVRGHHGGINLPKTETSSAAAYAKKQRENAPATAQKGRQGQGGEWVFFHIPAWRWLDTHGMLSFGLLPLGGSGPLRGLRHWWHRINACQT